jgi:hypothetical protein
VKKNIFLLLLFFTTKNQAQRLITQQEQQIWLGYLTETKFNQHWSWWNDAHWVPGSFGIVRTGITKAWNKPKIKTTVGYAFLMIYPPNGLTTYRPEHRPWGQTTLSHGSKPWSYFHRLRYEGRFRRTIIDDYLQNEFNFNFRLRYLFQARCFLNQEPDANYKWFLMASDEVLVNIGKEIKDGIRLDQNRISIGAGVLFKNTTIQLAYMNQLIESNTTFNFRMNHNLQLLVFQNFDW